MIFKGINQSTLRDLLDEAGIATKKDDEGDLMTVLSADDDFPYDMVAWFIVDEDNWLTIIARSFDFKVADPLPLANEYNRTHRSVSCVAEEEAVFFKLAFLLDEEVSSQYVIENCLRFGLSCSWRSFCDLWKNLNA